MRRMSFFLTQTQFRRRTKTVTRRTGWRFLKPGDRLLGIVKGQGLKKGEKHKKLGVIEVVRATLERVNAIDQEEVNREGFPAKDPAWFVAFFCKANGCRPHTFITRIEFKYVD